jgi:hypothetical protein
MKNAWRRYDLRHKYSLIGFKMDAAGATNRIQSGESDTLEDRVQPIPRLSRPKPEKVAPTIYYWCCSFSTLLNP